MLTRLRRWRALILAAIVLLLLGSIDALLKTTAEPGYCPENPLWTLAIDDFPGFYAALGTCDSSKAAIPELRKPLADVARGIRLATGIRPTPLRCRVWFGNKLLAAYTEEGIGFCVHPGLLTRLVYLYCHLIARTPTEEGVSRFGSFCYGWREGFLIVSPSSSYVRASLMAAKPSVESPEGRREMRLAWAGSKGALRVRPEDGLPVDGWIQGQLAPRRADGLSLSESWPAPPLMSVVVSRWSDLKILAGLARVGLEYASQRLLDEETRQQILSMAAEGVEYLSTQIDTDALPKDWDRSVDECALALWDIDTGETIPVPELALVLHSAEPAFGPHPFEKVLAADNGIPHEWDGRPGIVIPWMGEKLMLCLATRDQDRLLTTQEPLMAELIGAEITGRPREADAALALNWAKAGHCAGALLARAADLELVPRMNRKDVEIEWMPYIRAASHLGTLDLQATSRDGRIVFQGFLARQGAQTAAPPQP
jgi:hypothetical protein